MDTFSANVLPVSSIAERVKLYTPFSLKPMILSTGKISPSINSETSTSSPFLVRDHTKSISSIFFVSVLDRKSTRLNSSHVSISYAVFCLKKNNVKPTGRVGNEEKTLPGTITVKAERQRIVNETLNYQDNARVFVYNHQQLSKAANNPAER